MSTASFEPTMYLAVLPQILLVVVMGLVLVFDVAWSEERRRNLGWVTFGGIFVTLLLTLGLARPSGEDALVWGGMLRHDWLSFLFTLLALFGAAVTTLLGMDIENLGRKGEFYLLMLASTIGMTLMASAADLIMLFLAIETTSIPMYVLAGFFRTDQKSVESGFKYLLFGALTSAITLYGFSLLYGFSGGETNLYAIAEGINKGLSVGVLFGVLVLVLVGFSFKISAAPLHFWAPDVYEGAPTPVAGFLSTASKAAGFAVLMRFLLAAFPGTMETYWSVIIAVVAVLSMTIGNLLALAQRNIKRMLAYSSIAHAGYALVGLAAISNPVTESSLGINSVVYYLGAYLITNIAAFAVVAVFWHTVGSDEIAAYAGLSRRAPGLSLAMLVAFLSLAGMPPLGGFIAKVLVFAAAVEQNLIWLVVVGVLNSIIGLYYYLTVLKVVYLFRSEEEDKPLPVAIPSAVALVLLTVGIILVGTVFAPFFSMGGSAAAGLLP